MTKTGIGILVLVSLVSLGMAQDNYAILKQIEAAYQTNDYLSFTADYTYYSTLEAKEPSHTLTIQSHRKGAQYYLQMEGYELFGDGQTHLSIDHEGQTIQVLEGKYDIPGFGVAAFKEMAEVAGLQLTQLEAGIGKKTLLFSAPASSGTTIRLTYEDSSYRLLSSQLIVDVKDPNYYHEFNQSRMETNYKDYRLSNSFFSYRLKQFVAKSPQGVYSGTGKYKTYQIENLVK